MGLKNVKEGAIVVLICLLCYGRTFNGKFVFDDTEAVVNNKDLDIGTSWSSLIRNDFWGTNIKSNLSHKSYRPVTVAVYKSLVQIVGKEAKWFHLLNILLYVIVCLLFYKYLQILYKKIAFLTTILFVVHPIHTEVVASIVGCADLLCAVFFLLGLINFHGSILNESVVKYFVSIIFIGVSTFCKEVGIISIGVFLLLDLLLCIKKKNFSKSFYVRSLGLILTSALLLYVRCKVMDFTTPIFQKADNPASFSESIVTRFLSYSYIYALNGVLLIWPQWLCFDWSMGCIPLLVTPFDPRSLIVLTFYLTSIYYLYKTLKNRNQVVIFSLIIIGTTFLPATNIFFRVGFVIAERILFLPSAGFAILVTYGLEKLQWRYHKQKRMLTFLFYFLVIIFGSRTFLRASEWLNEETLFNSALNVCPNNAKVHYNVAKIAADQGKFNYAMDEYRVALALYPDYEQSMNNLANLLRDRGEFIEAKALLLKALSIRKDFPAAWMNLGIVLASLNEDLQSEQAYKQAIKFRKNYTDCFYNLGNLYLKLNRHQEAFESWAETVKIKPTHMAAWSNTLVLLDDLGQNEKVLEVGETALKHCPDSPAIHFTLANTLGKLQRWIEAEKHFKRAIELSPGKALYYSNFGVLYHRWGKVDKAKEMYQMALRFDPKSTTAATNLHKLLKK